MRSKTKKLSGPRGGEAPLRSALFQTLPKNREKAGAPRPASLRTRLSRHGFPASFCGEHLRPRRGGALRAGRPEREGGAGTFPAGPGHNVARPPVRRPPSLRRTPGAPGLRRARRADGAQPEAPAGPGVRQASPPVAGFPASPEARPGGERARGPGCKMAAGGRSRGGGSAPASLRDLYGSPGRSGAGARAGARAEPPGPGCPGGPPEGAGRVRGDFRGAAGGGDARGRADWRAGGCSSARAEGAAAPPEGASALGRPGRRAERRTRRRCAPRAPPAPTPWPWLR